MISYLKHKNYFAVLKNFTDEFYINVYKMSISENLNVKSNKFTLDTFIARKEFENINNANLWLSNEFQFVDFNWSTYNSKTKEFEVTYIFTDDSYPYPRLVTENIQGNLSFFVEKYTEGCLIKICGNKEGLKNLGKLLLLAAEDYDFEFEIDKYWHTYLEGSKKNVSIKIYNHEMKTDFMNTPDVEYQDIIDFDTPENSRVTTEELNLAIDELKNTINLGIVKPPNLTDNEPN